MAKKASTPILIRQVKGVFGAKVGARGNGAARPHQAAIESMYSMSPKKGLKLLKDAGIVTPTNKLARFYK